MVSKEIDGQTFSKKRNYGSYVAFTTTCLLIATSLLESVVAVFLLATQDVDAILGICQALVLSSAALSFFYFVFYLLAARRNDPVGIERPPSQPLHATCFVVLRIGIILWLSASIGCLIVALQMAECSTLGVVCPLQKISSACSLAAFLFSLALLSTLERFDQPFETPAVLHIRPRILCRLSAFDNDLLNRSVSRGSSFDEKFLEPEFPRTKVSRSKRLQRRAGTEITPIRKGGLPSQLSASTLVALSECHGNSEWAGKSFKKGYATSSVLGSGASDYSASSDGSSSYYNGRKSRTGLYRSDSYASWDSNASTLRKPRTAAPSSMISHESKRSKLSTMRSAEYPDIAVQPIIRVFPSASLPLCNPTASFRYHTPEAVARSRPTTPLRSSSQSVVIAPLSIRKQISRNRYVSERNTPAPSQPLPTMRRTTIEVKVPGAFPNYADTVEGHAKKIEESIQASVRYRETKKYAKNNPPMTPEVAQISVLQSLNNMKPELRKTSALRYNGAAREVRYTNAHSNLEIPLRRTSDKSPVLPDLDLGLEKLW